MLRSTTVNVAALLIIALLGSATLAATLTTAAGPDGAVGVQTAFEPGPETPEGTPEGEPAAESPELNPEEPGEETREAAPGTGFGAVRSEEARAFGACMREHGGDGQGNSACVEQKPGPAHQTPGHPGNGPDARPEHAGQGRPEHAGQGRPEHAGQGKDRSVRE